MSRTNETRHIEWHNSVCNNKQRWNEDKCRSECKELLTKEYVIKDLFGILLIVSVNVINHVILKNI